MGALDFAGGTVVHVNAAVAALVGRDRRRPAARLRKASILPHNVPFMLLGAGLLWFGWFGFNAGSALGGQPASPALAFVTTMLAPAATLVVWTLLDVARTGKPTAVGAATAIVVGLVAITPAAGFISPMSAHRARRASPRSRATSRIQWRAKTSLDDSLDVVAAHGVGGTVGALLTGVFAQKALNGVADGVLFGNPKQLLIQAHGRACRDRLQRRRELRPAEGDRRWSCRCARPARKKSTGLDIPLHGEEAYMHIGGMDAVIATRAEVFKPATAKSAAISTI